jgi:hypothetical protein
MHFTFISGDQRLTQAVAWKLLSGGLTLVSIGVLILLFPLILAMFVAAFCFLGGTALIGTAWRIFWSTRGTSKKPDVEEANWREVE